MMMVFVVVAVGVVTVIVMRTVNDKHFMTRENTKNFPAFPFGQNPGMDGEKSAPYR